MAPVLAYPQSEGLLILDTDASSISISGCLSQVQNGVERVLAYGSKSLSSAQRRYCTTKQELLAVVQCKRPACVSKQIRSTEAKILGVYSDVLELHEEYDVWEDEVFCRLPLIDDATPKLEKLNLIVATTQVGELSSESTRPNWLGSWTVDQLRQWQEEDPVIQKVKIWKLKSRNRPKWTEISPENGELKSFWSQWETLEVRDGILYRKFWSETSKTGSSTIYQLIAPKR